MSGPPTLAASTARNELTHADRLEHAASRVFVWSVAAMGAIISCEAAIPISSGESTLVAASSVPMSVALGASAVLLISGRVRRRVPPMVALWMAFFSVTVLSVGWSVDAGESIDDVATLASVAAVFLAVAIVDPLARLLPTLERAIVWGGALGAVWGIVGFITGTLPSGASGTPRFSSIDAPNTTAATLLLPFVLAVASAMGRESGGRLRASILGAQRTPVDAGLAAVLFCGILITGSRGGVVAAIVATGVLLLTSGRGRVSIRIVMALGALMVVVFLAAPPALKDHLTATHSTGRTSLWSLGVEACETYCLMGSGYGTFPAVYAETFRSSPQASGYHSAEFKAHNIWLEAAVEIGLAGLLVMLIAVVMTMSHALRSPPPRRGAALAGLAGVLVANMFLSHVSFRYFWLVLLYVALAGSVDRSPVGAYSAA